MRYRPGLRPFGPAPSHPLYTTLVPDPPLRPRCDCRLHALHLLPPSQPTYGHDAGHKSTVTNVVAIRFNSCDASLQSCPLTVIDCAIVVGWTTSKRQVRYQIMSRLRVICSSRMKRRKRSANRSQSASDPSHFPRGNPAALELRVHPGEGDDPQRALRPRATPCSPASDGWSQSIPLEQWSKSTQEAKIFCENILMQSSTFRRHDGSRVPQESRSIRES